MGRCFIAEKPSMAGDLAQVLGVVKRHPTHYECKNGDVVTWCFGHLLEQAKPEAYDERIKEWALAYLPVIPPTGAWKKFLKPDAGIKKQFNAITSLVKECDVVVNAGDPDREGNLLVDEVLEKIGNKKSTLRLWLHALNESDIKKALAAMKPNSSYAGHTAAAEARSRADWLIGMNFTCGFTVGWQSKGNAGTIHIGRVQTPTLWLVVERDREIENFKPVDYFVAKFDFIHKNGTFAVTWQVKPDSPGVDADGRLLDRSVAEALVAKLHQAQGRVSKVKSEHHRKSPPLPFSLADIQKAANNIYGYSPDKVLGLCQALYETHKLTSYPRTDCGYLPEAQFAEAPDVISAVKGTMGNQFDCPCQLDMSYRSPAWNDSKVTAHHGIIPTAKAGNFAALSQDEQNIYRLVVRNYLAQFAPLYVYESTSITVEAESEEFVANGKVNKQLGWRLLFGADETDEKELPLPAVAQHDPGVLSTGRVVANVTKPPARFNGGSLIEAMENAHRFIADERIRKNLKKCEGLGTPATRAGIVKNLVDRGYIETLGKGKKAYYQSSEKGRNLIDSLPDVIRRPDLTAYFEDLLSQIEEGGVTLEDFTAKQARFVTTILNEIKSGEALANMPQGTGQPRGGGKSATTSMVPQPCIHSGCSSQMTRHQAKAPSKRLFWVCENKHYADDKDDKPVPQVAHDKVRPAPQKVGRSCPNCGSDLVARTSTRGKFTGCSGFPKCNYKEG